MDYYHIFFFILFFEYFIHVFQKFTLFQSIGWLFYSSAFYLNWALSDCIFDISTCCVNPDLLFTLATLTFLCNGIIYGSMSYYKCDSVDEVSEHAYASVWVFRESYLVVCFAFVSAVLLTLIDLILTCPMDGLATGAFCGVSWIMGARQIMLGTALLCQVRKVSHNPFQSNTQPSSKYHITLFKVTHNHLQSDTQPSSKYHTNLSKVARNPLQSYTQLSSKFPLQSNTQNSLK